MKFQNPSLVLFLNGRTDGRTEGRTDKPKPICSHFFKVWGIKMSNNYEILRGWVFNLE